MIINIAKQISARGVNIASSFVCAIVIGNQFGSTAFAEYAFSISFINIFSAICLLGLEISISREYFSNSFNIKKKISGAIIVAASFIALSTLIFSFSAFFGKDFSSPPLLAAAFITAISFYFSNIIKYENSIYIFEFIRGGGINTVCLILILATPISALEIENHNLILYSSLLILVIALLALATRNAQTKNKIITHVSTSSFVLNSISLSFTALLSSIIVSGDLILAKLALPQNSYESMALVTRISFLLAIPFIILNNNYSVEIARLKDEWPLAKRLLLNTVAAGLISITAIIFSNNYLLLFSRDYDKQALAPIIYLIIASHALNIASSGLIPYLACTNRKRLNIAVLTTTVIAPIIYLLAQKMAHTSPEIKFSIAFYSTLFILKLLIILLATLKPTKKDYSQNDNF